MCDYFVCNSEVVEPEGIVLSPSSVSQMLSSPGDSIVEEIFAPNEVVINSPLDELIREVSISPTEELIKPNSTMVNVSSSNLATETSNSVGDKSKKRVKKDVNLTKKKKRMLVNNNNKSKSSNTPFIIKMEPSGNNDPPVISIPDMDIPEPDVSVYIFNS